MSTARTIAYLATSVDGLIAGPDDDLAWLSEERVSGHPIAAGAWAEHAEGGLGFDELLARVGCMLMGRRTYDAVLAIDVPWPYGNLPVRVATTQPSTDERSTITPVEGPIDHLIEDALAVAGGKDVYVDGGKLVRATLAAGLLDELVVTILPVGPHHGRARFHRIARCLRLVAALGAFGIGRVDVDGNAGLLAQAFREARVDDGDALLGVDEVRGGDAVADAVKVGTNSYGSSSRSCPGLDMATLHSYHGYYQ